MAAIIFAVGSLICLTIDISLFINRKWIFLLLECLITYCFLSSTINLFVRYKRLKERLKNSA